MRPHEEITNEEQHEPAHAPGLRDMTPIPGSIVKAVCSVMAASAAVNKSQKNQHGGYMFASTDDIYAAVTRKMGEAGLICLCLEETPPKLERFEKEGKISQWMNISYTFVLATADATWTDKRSRRTLFIQITGPQTFQAAQSYAEKSYLRSLFKIPTGDMDLDSLPDGFEYNSVNRRPPRPTLHSLGKIEHEASPAPSSPSRDEPDEEPSPDSLVAWVPGDGASLSGMKERERAAWREGYDAFFNGRGLRPLPKEYRGHENKVLADSYCRGFEAAKREPAGTAKEDAS